MKYSNKTSIVIKFYRLSNFFYRHKFKCLSKIIYHLIQILFGCTIPYSCELGKNVNIAHYHGIVFHHLTKIGDNTIIYQNVSIGGRNGKRGPIIGENCIIGAGACVLGDITVGNNVKIGANAVVLEDIPDNCTVVGIPGKIIKKGGE